MSGDGAGGAPPNPGGLALGLRAERAWVLATGALELAGLSVAASLPGARWPDFEVPWFAVLVSSGEFWGRMERQVADPVDTHCTAAARAFAEAVGGSLLWPGSSVDLRALGEGIGLARTSPLGVGVSARWGPWFAYRGVVGFGAGPLIEPAPSPCPCAERPCIAACGPGTAGDAYDWSACGEAKRHGCAADCAARRACPFGAEHGYSGAQLAHHHAAALRLIDAFEGGG